MPKEGAGKEGGNQKERRNTAGVPNLLVVIRNPVLLPFTGSGEKKKGASHTQASGTRKEMKGASNTQVQGTVAETKGASIAQAGAKKKKASNLNAGVESILEEKRLGAQADEGQTKRTLTYLARELSSMGGPLLSDTLDVNHLACYLALEAEKNHLAPRLCKGDCLFTVIELWQQCVEVVRQSRGNERHHEASTEEDWMHQQYQNLHDRRQERSVADGIKPAMTSLEVIKCWLTGAVQRLQVSKNREGTVSGESTSEDTLKRSREAVSIGLEKECYDAALEGEVEIKGDFFKRSRGGITRDTRPSKEELQQLNKWMAEEMGSKRDVAAVKDTSWIWQMYCLLSEDRRIQTLYSQYETLMLGAAERLEGRLRDLASQAGAGAKEKASHKEKEKKIIVNVGLGKRAATSHGQGVVVNEEVIDVELEDFTLLGEDSFTPLKFFSRSDDDGLCDVDYDTDSQKGISVGSPFSLQLAFSSPLSLDKDLSASWHCLRIPQQRQALKHF
jgi:hypothetical protein